MAQTKHKVFISYHHSGDQEYKDKLLALNKKHGIFIDGSVDTGDISDDLDDQTIRAKIRDEYLRDTTVTILLVGEQTKGRKHVDWELYSSMINGSKNKKSGVLVIMLPTTGCNSGTAAHGDPEKKAIYPPDTNWITVSSRTGYEKRYPAMPDRIIDNLLKDEAKISVVTWAVIEEDPEKLRTLIGFTHEDKTDCEYDLSREMRRANS